MGGLWMGRASRRKKEKTPSIGGAPLKLYKFTEAKWANAMCDHGSERIGTLYEYRDAERYEAKVLDREEGRLRYSEHLVHATSENLPLLSTTLFKVDNPTHRFHNVRYGTETSEPDCHIYCLSISNSWSADLPPKYDTCVEIADIDRFVLVLCRILGNKLKVHGPGVLHAMHGPVLYAGRDHSLVVNGADRTGGIPARPAFLKPADAAYASQQEYRLLFEGASPPSGPVDSADPEIAQLCRIVSRRP
jgi:hypothetical protein